MLRSNQLSSWTAPGQPIKRTSNGDVNHIRSAGQSYSLANPVTRLNLRNREEDPNELQSYEDMVRGGGGSGGAGERASSYGGPGEKAFADNILLRRPERVGAVAEYRGSEKFGWQGCGGRV